VNFKLGAAYRAAITAERNGALRRGAEVLASPPAAENGL